MAKRKVIKSRANIYWDGGKFLNSLGGNPVDGKLTTGLFKGMSTGTGNLISGIGSAVGKIGGGLIAGGLESGAGNAISSIGSTIGSIIPGPMGGLVSAAAGVVGGLTNKMFGSKLNKENIAKVENNIGQLSSFTSDASSFDSLADNYSSAPTMGYFSRKDIGKDGWFSNKAKKKYKALKKQADLASKWVDNSLLNNAENIENTMAQNLEANYAAFGGPLGGIAIGYELAKQDLANKELAALGRNKITSMPNSFGPISTFAFGGHTHGANFTNGITLIDAGGSHESNPYEGVPMGVDVEGTPNLVEEGEVVWNDYVFSNRIPVPQAIRNKYKLRKKKDITFADAAEFLAKESEERPNDPISQAGLTASLNNLMQGQEEIREKDMNTNKYSLGGNKKDGYDWTQFLNTLGAYNKSKIKGNSANKYAVDSSLGDIAALEATPEYQAFTNYVLNNSTDANVLNYLRALDSGTVNASKLFDGDSLAANWADVYRARRNDGLGGIYHLGPSMLAATSAPVVEPVTPIVEPAPKRNPRNIYHVLQDGKYVEMDHTTFAGDPNFSKYNRVDGKTHVDDAGDTHLYYDPYTEEELKQRPEWLRYAPAVGLGIATITDALGLTNKPDYDNADALLEATRSLGSYRPVSFSPIGNYLTYTPLDREFHTNRMRSSAAAGRRAIANTAGGNRASAVAGILASDFNTLAQYGNLARQAEEFNLAQRQKVEDFNRATNMFNSEGFLKADMANQSADSSARGLSLRGLSSAYSMRESARALADQAKSANISGFIQALGDIGYENANRNMRDWAISKGVFGPIKKSKGGKIRRKGLTF